MIDFFGPGWLPADGLGIVPRLRDLGYQVQRLDYVDRKGESRASLSFAKFAKVARGELVSLLRPDLELAIREVMPRTLTCATAALCRPFDRAANR